MALIYKLTTSLCIFFLVCTHSTQAQKGKRISPKLFYSLTQKHPDALILDVRLADKFAKYRIKKAVPLPTKSELIDLSQSLPKQDTIFVYCEYELRSVKAVQTLDSLGFKNVFELKGGLASWRRNGLPLDREKLDK